MAYTDPLSGPFAQVGDANLKQMQYIIDFINAKGGALGKKFELVPFDNKSQPSDALIALKSATDQNMPFIMQCSGSNIAAALIDGVNKHNDRNPDNRIIYLNCGAVATELTNEQCSFWHFRFDLHVGMKAEVMVRALPKETKKVYLINQDYLFGQSVQREVKNFLAKLRPDVQVVGDELIPLGKVKDFSPYITKINASGAQALLTGNWGPDMNLLIKAGVDAGADLRYYTFYAHLAGGPTAIGVGGDNRVLAVMSFSENVAPEIGNKEAEAFTKGFREKHKFDFSAAGFRTIFEYLQASREQGRRGRCDQDRHRAGGSHGQGLPRLRDEDAQGRPPDHQRVLRRYLQEGREVRRRRHRPRLGDLGDHSGQGRRPAQYLQDEASDRVVNDQRPLSPGERASPAGGRGAMEVFVVSLLNGLVYGMLLFMLASGLTLILSHDGRAQFRPCQRLHAGRLLRLHDQPLYRLLAGAGRGAAAVRADRRGHRDARACGASIATATSPSCCSPSALR